MNLESAGTGPREALTPRPQTASGAALQETQPGGGAASGGSESVALASSRPASSAPASIARRHDLDALRAIAMLLGIFLHGAIAYIPMAGEGWSVHDPNNSHVFGVLMSIIHGFRMPLFFLISGFFTAMLWRKRGLGSLIKHRLKRILLPLAIGFVTLVPLVWVVSIGAGIHSSSITAKNPPTLWSAVRDDDQDEITRILADGVDVNALERETGTTALSIAAGRGFDEIMSVLIDAGADVNVRNRDGSTPLHAAALLGKTDAVSELLAHGARTDTRNRLGEFPAEMVTVNGMRLLLSAGMNGVELQEPPNRSEVAEMLAKASPETAPVQPNDGKEQFGLGVVVLLLTLLPAFHHLWFLWFLCWLVAAFVVYALVIGNLNIKFPRSMVVTPIRYAWLIPLTMLPQAYMGILFPNYGPDTSTGIVPMPQILIYYAVFFFFGAMYFDCDDDAGMLGRWWKMTLPLALFVVFPIGYELTTGGLGFTKQAWLDSQWCRPLSIFLQVLYVWLMTFGSIGMFRSLLSKESRTMRYISDSAYWMYLAHLPLVIVAQAVLIGYSMPALVKLTLVCVGSSLILLASYQWFVRYTPIGTLLNGPKTRRRKAAGPPVASSGAVEGTG